MAKYDPNKQYKWEEESDFTLGGNEFGLILNVFRTVLNSPEAKKILLIEQANNVAEGVLKRHVETGLVKEVPEEPQTVASPPLKVVEDSKAVKK